MSNALPSLKRVCITHISSKTFKMYSRGQVKGENGKNTPKLPAALVSECVQKAKLNRACDDDMLRIAIGLSDESAPLDAFLSPVVLDGKKKTCLNLYRCNFSNEGHTLLISKLQSHHKDLFALDLRQVKFSWDLVQLFSRSNVSQILVEYDRTMFSGLSTSLRLLRKNNKCRLYSVKADQDETNALEKALLNFYSICRRHPRTTRVLNFLNLETATLRMRSRGISKTIRTLNRLPKSSVVDPAEVYLGFCKLKQLPRALKTGLPLLKELDLTGNSLTDCPLPATAMTHLTHLNLEMNHLAEFSPSILELKVLEKLNLSGNRIPQIPQDITKLGHLRTLLLSNNPLENISALEYIPNEKETLPNLRCLIITDCTLRQIPRLSPALDYLQIDHNPVGPDVTHFDFLKHTPHLRVFFAKDTDINDFPEQLCQLPSLESLDLTKNNITEIPDSFSKMTQLQAVNFRQNKLVHLPSSISALSELCHLHLNHNQLRGITG